LAPQIHLGGGFAGGVEHTHLRRCELAEADGIGVMRVLPQAGFESRGERVDVNARLWSLQVKPIAIEA